MDHVVQRPFDLNEVREILERDCGEQILSVHGSVPNLHDYSYSAVAYWWIHSTQNRSIPYKPALHNRNASDEEILQTHVPIRSLMAHDRLIGMEHLLHQRVSRRVDLHR